ncbi:MAG: decarboxylase, partial [Gammaproteobacteria bacterium]|nr:decarboxylase [Gammaproteobacteria bacterium]
MPLNRWITSIADSGLALLGLKSPEHSLDRIIALCRDLTSNKGEALGTALAREVTRTYQHLNDEDRIVFFRWLKEELSPSPEGILKAAHAYAEEENRHTLLALMEAAEPPRQNLFRRINMAPGGTSELVNMRKLLRQAIRDEPELAVIDVDLQHLMNAWFNRGFLELRHINWETPADLLEKIMSYESVHEMSGWEDLKRRLADDRRCFAFFH